MKIETAFEVGDKLEINYHGKRIVDKVVSIQVLITDAGYNQHYWFEKIGDKLHYALPLSDWRKVS